MTNQLTEWVVFYYSLSRDIHCPTREPWIAIHCGDVGEHDADADADADADVVVVVVVVVAAAAAAGVL